MSAARPLSRTNRPAPSPGARTAGRAVTLLLAALALFAAAPAAARAADPVEETFLTADGVQLHGLFSKSAKTPGTDPVVVLLYPPGKDHRMTQGDWKGLATLLAKNGYNVLQFDWRGHGKSTTISDPARFWNLAGPNDQFAPNPFTGPWHTARTVRGAPTNARQRIKNEIEYADLVAPARYAPAYLLDLAAARHHLDLKNDAGEVNTSSVYLIGSGDAAALGIGWLATEWNRPAFAPTPNQLAVFAQGAFPTYRYVPQPLAGGLPNELGGGDVSGAVWLSPARPTSVSSALLKSWVSGTPKLRDNNPMLFLYAPKDAAGKAQARYFANDVLVANPPAGASVSKLEQTLAHEVERGEGLRGDALLGANAGTEEVILQYLEALQKNRAKLIRKTRNFTAPWSVQLAQDFGLAGTGFGFRP